MRVLDCSTLSEWWTGAMDNEPVISWRQGVGNHVSSVASDTGSDDDGLVSHWKSSKF